MNRPISSLSVLTPTSDATHEVGFTKQMRAIRLHSEERDRRPHPARNADRTATPGSGVAESMVAFRCSSRNTREQRERDGSRTSIFTS
ncbi:hypothetical protein HSB1_31920 [Halogranum salarium B-1]|uniref:Uncharacterized protein n=1 Tax=Halogranum salarium B-1 TaxID=1210908 RepID=J3JEW4_9EURY|nr:hypothetical protein HSB1_31920 [Halogranum salarium B-1]